MKFVRCFSCMQELDAENEVCPHCGFDASQYMEAEYILRLGTILQGRYIVGKVLGKGGFGITYIGYDMTLDIKVAIKEYYPEGFVGRDARQSSELIWYSTRNGIEYVKNSRDNLLKEARNMAKIDTFPTLARIRDVFMANETAYLVMDYIEGVTLKDLVMKNGTLAYDKLRTYLCPVMGDLAKIHEKGIIHRDISPDNIMVETNGGVRLLDLGAAKDLYQSNRTQKIDLEKTLITGEKRNVSDVMNSWTGENVPESTQMVLKHGFSPLEQYRTHGEIGPWTDVYAMAATMYYLLSGKVLPTPMDRLASEEEEKVVQDVINALEIPQKAKEGMKRGLAVLKKDRTKTMNELLEYFPEKQDPALRPRPNPKRKVKWLIALLGTVVIAGGAYAVMSGPALQKKAEKYYEAGKYKEALSAYQKAGDAEGTARVLQAAYDLAGDYRTGNNGQEIDEEEAVLCYKLVAENDSTEEGLVQNSCFWVGYILSHNDAEEDDTEAKEWFEKAVEKGETVSFAYLGWMYETGKGVSQDYGKMIEFYKQGAEAENDYCMNRLGDICENGSCDQEKNLEEALKWYGMAADKEYDGAQESVERVLQVIYDLAEDYRKGQNGQEKDEEKSIRYFKLVAENDRANDELVGKACFRIGLIMQYNDTKEDDTEAMSWYEKSMEKGFAAGAVAATSIAHMYRDGQGVEQDYDKAMEFYRQSAEDGSSMAMYELGDIYENGGCSQEIDLEAALKWYEKAAAKNYEGAQEGVERVQKKLGAGTEASDENDTGDRTGEAYNRLGRIYEDSGNLEKALEAYKKAAAKGYTGAQESVERVEQALQEGAGN